jgi:FkbM family methyltransferase
METSLRRMARRLLAKSPGFYLMALRALHRGSAEKRLYLSLIRRGDVILDVGANVGYFTMLFSDLVGKKGEVHAFEPIHGTFAELSRNIGRFPGYRNVRLKCAALGDRSNPIRMFLPGSDSGQAALVRHRDGSWEAASIASIDVEMIRLDEYAGDLPRIDFVKCDVEGAELLVLIGGQSILKRLRPRLLLEVDNRWLRSFGRTAEDLFSLLRQIGYSHFYSVGSKLVPLSENTYGEGEILCSWEELDGLAQSYL